MDFDYLNLPPLLAIIGLTLVARATLGSWLAPGAFFPLIWSAMILLGMTVPEYPPWPAALWWMFAALAVFYAGNLLAGGRPVGEISWGSAPPQREVQLPHLHGIGRLLFLIALVYVLLKPIITPRPIDNPPLWFQVLLIANYAAPLLAGMGLAVDRSWRGWSLAALINFPAVVNAILSTGRSSLLAAIYFTLAGYWSVRTVQRRGQAPLLTLRTLIVAPLLLITLSVLGTGIGRLRAIDNTRELTISERLTEYPELLRDADPDKEWYGFRHGVLSHPYAFSVYLKRALDHPPEPQYGMLTFSGPLELVGLHQRTCYEAFEVDEGVYSNVYSLFMPPIEDFGLVGSFVSFFVAGLIAGWGYLRVSQGSLPYIPILTMFYTHVLVIGGYFFAYNSMVFAHVVLGAYLLWCSRVNQPPPICSTLTMPFITPGRRPQASDASHSAHDPLPSPLRARRGDSRDRS